LAGGELRGCHGHRSFQFHLPRHARKSEHNDQPENEDRNARAVSFSSAASSLSKLILP
jgi:hypothetical protein